MLEQFSTEKNYFKLEIPFSIVKFTLQNTHTLQLRIVIVISSLQIVRIITYLFKLQKEGLQPTTITIIEKIEIIS